MWQFTGKQRPSFAQPVGPGQESVWDYPRPPVCRPDHRLITVQYGGRVLAKSTGAVRILETASPPTVYLPPDDIDLEQLVAGSGNSWCEWKGAATYWSLVTPEGTIANVGWSYQHPSPTFASIAGFLSFYPAILDCFVGDEQVRPQPGGFYGGWVTDEIVGPYKGEPGTSGW